ncbi:MAG: ADP-ribosylglycohydrolase family protein [Candidatus Paceibacterota bacterium]
MGEISILESYQGTLIGGHVADSIAAPYETWGPKEIAADIKKRGGLKFFDYRNPWAKDGNGKILPAGRPTDDSDQTADLCHSLIACNGLDTTHLREALCDSVVRGKSRLWDGKATGAGTTTRNALTADAKTVRLNGVPMNNIGTNGSLMRCAPMALWLFRHVDQARVFNPAIGYTTPPVELVHAMSAVTHVHQHAKDACWLYTKFLTAILDGLTWARKPENGLETRVLSRLNDQHDLPYDPGAWPMRGTAEFSLYVALYALRHSNSFAEGIEIAVRVGGDTDTYAAIAGGLLGARYGYSGIPREWRNTILGHDQMIAYADALCDMRMHE